MSVDSWLGHLTHFTLTLQINYTTTTKKHACMIQPKDDCCVGSQDVAVTW